MAKKAAKKAAQAEISNLRFVETVERPTPPVLTHADGWQAAILEELRGIRKALEERE